MKPQSISSILLLYLPSFALGVFFVLSLAPPGGSFWFLSEKS